MTNIHKFPEIAGKSGDFAAEASPDGIRIGNRVIGYRAMIRHLDEGAFDDDLLAGIRVVGLFPLGGTQDGSHHWFAPDDDQLMILWRWVIAALFCLEQGMANGTVLAKQADGTEERVAVYRGEHGGIALYPFAERAALANNLEGVAFEKYTHDNPQQRAIQIYQSMVDISSGAMRLNEWANESMAVLHDGFIESLNRDGMPDAPVTH